MGTGLTALGEEQVNFGVNGGPSGLIGTQADPAVAALANGEFVAVYESPPGSGGGLTGHLFDASGNPIGWRGSGSNDDIGFVEGGNAELIDPAVAATPDGGFLVAYTNASVVNNSIEVRRFDPTTGFTTPFTIDSGSASRHQPNVGTVNDAVIGTFADGTSVVAWDFDFNSDPTDDDVFFAFLNSSATGFTTANGVVHDPRPLTIANGFEGEPSIATSGNFAAIVYADDPGHKQGDQDITLVGFNSSGTQLVPPTPIFGSASLDVFSQPDVAALSDGRLVVVARDDTTSSLVASIFDPVTRALTPVSFSQPGADPYVAATPGGGFAISFDNPSGDVSEARVGPVGSAIFSAGVANSVTTGVQDENAIAANASGTVFLAWQDTSPSNPNSTDADTSPNPGAAWKAIGAGNFNDDGHSDILWQNTSSGQGSIWEMNGSSLIGGGPVTPNPGPSFRAVGTGDFDDDGHSDILWQNTNTGQASIWEMNGNTLTGGGPVTPNPGPTCRAVGTGDFNGDGHSDMLWQNANGQASIWEMTGNTLMGGGVVSPNPGPAWKAIGTGDFNGDGFSDILWQNTNTGQASVWEMNGNTLIGGGPVSPNPGPSWRAVGTGDFNGDGFADIRCQNTSTGQSVDLGDGREHPHGRGSGQPQSWKQLAFSLGRDASRFHGTIHRIFASWWDPFWP